MPTSLKFVGRVRVACGGNSLNSESVSLACSVVRSDMWSAVHARTHAALGVNACGMCET